MRLFADAKRGAWISRMEADWTANDTGNHLRSASTRQRGDWFGGPGLHACREVGAFAVPTGRVQKQAQAGVVGKFGKRMNGAKCHNSKTFMDRFLRHAQTIAITGRSYRARAATPSG